VYAFATSEAGELVQFELAAAGEAVTGNKVRSLSIGSDSEGCVADDELGHLYVNEERGAVWKYGAEPSSGTARTQIDSLATGRLEADLEGATIYYGDGGDGYVIVSSQGSSTFAVYERAGDNRFVGSFDVAGGGDAVSATDGIDVTSAALGNVFPGGLLVVHDAQNTGAQASNFKFVAWEEIAATLGLADGSSGVPAPEPAPSTAPDEGAAAPQGGATRVSTKILRDRRG
jgi:3-phytase